MQCVEGLINACLRLPPVPPHYKNFGSFGGDCSDPEGVSGIGLGSNLGQIHSCFSLEAKPRADHGFPIHYKEEQYPDEGF